MYDFLYIVNRDNISKLLSFWENRVLYVFLRQTDEQVDNPDALRRSRCRQRRLKKALMWGLQSYLLVLVRKVMQEHKRIATDAYFVLNPLELQLHFPPSVTTLSVFHQACLIATRIYHHHRRFCVHFNHLQKWPADITVLKVVGSVKNFSE